MRKAVIKRILSWLWKGNEDEKIEQKNYEPMSELVEEFGEEQIKYFLDNNMVQHRYLDITEALYNSIKTVVKEKED